jgi:hypothetical protein
MVTLYRFYVDWDWTLFQVSGWSDWERKWVCGAGQLEGRPRGLGRGASNLKCAPPAHR